VRALSYVSKDSSRQTEDGRKKERQEKERNRAGLLMSMQGGTGRNAFSSGTGEEKTKKITPCRIANELLQKKKERRKTPEACPWRAERVRKKHTQQRGEKKRKRRTAPHFSINRQKRKEWT